MTVQQPQKTGNSNTTVIVVVIAAVVLLCCVVGVLGAGGLFYFLQRNGTINNVVHNPPFPFTPAPTQNGQQLPGPTPSGPAGAVVVEAFDPSTGNYPGLSDLVPTWIEPTSPSSRNWSVSLQANQSVVILLGWCTTTPQILQQNDQQIKWTLTVDGKPVDVQKLFPLDEQLTDRVCKSYAGIIRSWPGRQHIVTTTMTVSQKINDGFNDYAAGDYTDVYTVKVGQ